MRPRIAIPVPTSGDLAYNSLNWKAYADAVTSSGGEPVSFALGWSRRQALSKAGECEGIVLPGSPADVTPAKYGQPRDEASAASDEARERMDELLIELAEQTRRPLLAICFGAQMLNVVRGGTLIQNLGIFPVNHAAGRAIGVAHTVAVDDGSFLGAIVQADVTSSSGRLAVNSSHHQAIGIPGTRLRVSARCPQDGVVEAVEDEGSLGLVMGVQWHPERTFDTSAASRALFAKMVEAASVWREALAPAAG